MAKQERGQQEQRESLEGLNIDELIAKLEVANQSLSTARGTREAYQTMAWKVGVEKAEHDRMITNGEEILEQAVADKQRIVDEIKRRVGEGV